MPTIDLGPEDSLLAAGKMDRIKAVMLYPSSIDRQQAYLHHRHDHVAYDTDYAAMFLGKAVERARFAAGQGEGHFSDQRPFAWTATAAAKDYDGGHRVRDLKGTAAEEDTNAIIGEAKGRIAGYMLSYMLRASREVETTNASLQKARFVAGKELERIPESHRVIGISQKPVRDAWKEYKPVAHFWAALMMAEEQDKYCDFDEQPTHLDLLQWSEQLLEESIRVNVPGIALNPAWRPPKGLSLPGTLLEILPLAEPVIELLESYDSPLMRSGRRS